MMRFSLVNLIIIIAHAIWHYNSELNIECLQWSNGLLSQTKYSDSLDNAMNVFGI